MFFTAKKKKNNRLENQKNHNNKNNNNNKNNPEEDLRQTKRKQNQKSMRAKRRETKTRVEKTGFSIDDVKKLDNLYLRQLETQRLQNLSKLSINKNVYGNENTLHQISLTSPQIPKV